MPKPLESVQDTGSRLKIKLPGGSQLDVTGTLALMVVLIVVAVAAILYFVQLRVVEAKDFIAAHDAATKETAGKIIAKVEGLGKGMEEMSYILTLSDEQRKALNLDMPESLRQKTREPVYGARERYSGRNSQGVQK